MAETTLQAIADEAYRRFPDEVEPMEGHPMGRIVVDRGNMRYAFIEGFRLGEARAKVLLDEPITGEMFDTLMSVPAEPLFRNWRYRP
jgi:hypothetical protein